MKKLLPVFLTLITAAWAVSIAIDDAYLIKWLGVLLCALLALACGLAAKRGWFIVIGMAFVCVADNFMTLNPGPVIAGLIFFFAAQLSFFIHIIITTGGKCIKPTCILTAAIIAIFTGTAAAGFLGSEGFLFCLFLSLYVGIFVTNIIISFARHCPLALSFGLCSYFICDIFVGLSYLIPLSVFIKLVWVFYLPGLTLISASNLLPERSRSTS